MTQQHNVQKSERTLPLAFFVFPSSMVMFSIKFMFSLTRVDIININSNIRTLYSEFRNNKEGSYVSSGYQL